MNRWNKERKRVVGLFLEWYESLHPYDRHVFECCMGGVIKQIVEDEQMHNMDFCPKCNRFSVDGYICLHDECDWVKFTVEIQLEEE